MTDPTRTPPSIRSSIPRSLSLASDAPSTASVASTRKKDRLSALEREVNVLRAEKAELEQQLVDNENTWAALCEQERHGDHSPYKEINRELDHMLASLKGELQQPGTKPMVAIPAATSGSDLDSLTAYVSEYPCEGPPYEGTLRSVVLLAREVHGKAAWLISQVPPAPSPHHKGSGTDTGGDGDGCVRQALSEVTATLNWVLSRKLEPAAVTPPTRETSKCTVGLPLPPVEVVASLHHLDGHLFHLTCLLRDASRYGGLAAYTSIRGNQQHLVAAADGLLAAARELCGCLLGPGRNLQASGATSRWSPGLALPGAPTIPAA